MIDYYHNIKSLNCEYEIGRCLDYYKEYLLFQGEYDDIYDEYDIVASKVLTIDYDENTIVFKSKMKDGRRHLKIHTKFMQACLLESLKRLVEMRTMEECKDVDSELNHDIQTYMTGQRSTENHFIYYPDIYEDKLSDKIISKEEFKRHIIPDETGSIKDKCDSQFFELAPHQLFLKNLISPNTHYHGLLIFHGVGVGKSCSGISIAENFRDIYGKEENKIIILASQNIRIGWKKTIFDPERGDNQCTGSDYYYDDDHEMDQKYAKKKIKKYYELHGYAAFANSVQKMLNEGCLHISDDKERLRHQIKLIKEKYSNRVLIIDEVHNIRSGESQKNDRDTIHYIEMVIKYSDKLRLILLTANPMYNLSTEIVWILNMLLLNDNRPIILEKDIFDKEGNLIDEELLMRKSNGYISYLRGENPISFPVRLYPKDDLNRIIKKPDNGDKDLRPSLDLFHNRVPDEYKLSFLELYSSSLNGHQLKIYMNEIEKYHALSNLQIDVENILLQISNIVYPGPGESYTDLYGDNGLTNTMKIDKNIYSYQKDILEDPTIGEYFHRKKIGEYSSKIESILESIQNSEGIVFIYSNWIKSGVIPMVLALEQNGYTKYDGKEVLKGSNKIEKISCAGKYSSEYTDKKNFNKANYMVIAGSGIGSTNLEEELRMAVSEENKNGHKIKIIIGSSVASEGLDFKNIRSIHILEPWHNINKLEQVIGRGIRNCSHKTLESEKRNVTIYLHTSIASETETIDMYLYRYSEKKAKQIGKIENILKSVAIDKYIFQEGNYFDKNDIDMINVKPAHRTMKSKPYDRSDKEYSRVCSFSKICNYMANDKNKSILIPDKNKYDTFQMNYSSSVIEIYKKRIHNLYLTSISYTFNELNESLSLNKETYPDFLYHAIKEMISEKYSLHNVNGDKGYLIRIDEYYLFQPYYNNDILLPAYYRLNKGTVNSVNYEIKYREKKINTFLYEKHIFTEDSINRSFEKISSFVFKDHELKIFDVIGIGRPGLNSITMSYLFDRLLIDDKLVIGYSVLVYLKENEILFDEEIIKLLINCICKLFIYYDGSKYYYRDEFKVGNETDLVGFFLYNNNDKKPLYYNYHNREIEIFNKVDEMDIVIMMKANRNSKSLSVSGSWGFLTYSERIKYSDPRYTHNGIVLKVIKSSDNLKKNYVYPGGPGIIIQDQASGAWIGDSTYQFIIDTFPDIVASLSEASRKGLQSNNPKRDYVCCIECFLRMKNLCIQNDLIFMKYY